MSVNVILGDAAEFSSFNANQNFIMVYSNKLEVSHIGVYEIRIFSSYQNAENKTQEFDQTFTLTVYDKFIPPVVKPEAECKAAGGTWDKTTETCKKDDDKVPEEEQKPVLLIKDFDGPVYESIKEAPYEKASPIPYVIDLQMNGLLKIGWDQKMEQLEDSDQLQEQQIAIRSWQEKTFYDRRKLQQATTSPEFVLLTNQTTLETEEFRIVNPLEIVLINEESDPETQAVPWTFIEQTDDYMVIQMDFEDANSFAPLANEYLVKVTFWGVDLFKSKTNHSVRYGTELNWKVYRQISPEQQEKVETFDVLYDVKMVIVLLLFPICLLGSSLPTLMFLNTLQLIAYFPLMNSVMPANLHQFLIKYLDLVRLNFNGLSQTLEESQGIINQQVSTDHEIHAENNSLLQACGYGTLFVNNTVVILSILAFTGLVWLILVLKDCGFKRYGIRNRSFFCKRNHEGSVSNLAIRLLYQAFLELTICALISLSMNYTGSGLAGFSWFASVMVSVLLLTLVGLLILRLFTGGPNVQDYYLPLSCGVLCCWNSRQRNIEFDHEAHKTHYLLRQKSLTVDAVFLKGPILDSDLKKSENETPMWLNEQMQTERALMNSPETHRPRHSLMDRVDQGGDLESGVVFSSDDRKYEVKTNFKANNNFVDCGLSNQNDSRGEWGSCELKTEAIPDFIARPMKTLTQRHSLVGSIVSLESEGVKHINIPTGSMLGDDLTGRHNINFAGSSSKARTVDGESSGKSKAQAAFYEGGQLEKFAHKKISRKEIAQRDSQIEKTIQLPIRYKTLYNGLKLNHERNVAVVHPLAFLLRRVLLAVIIVFMGELRHTGLFIFIGYTLFMLAYVCIERQWKDPVINYQHILNEGFLYIFCLFMVYFSIVETGVYSRFTLGYVFIGVFIVWMCLNLTFIIVQAIERIKLLLKRSYYRSLRHKLAEKVKAITKKLQVDFDDGVLNPCQDEGDSSPQVLVEQKFSREGGFKVQFKKEQHSMSLDDKLDPREIRQFMTSATGVRKPGKTGKVMPIISADGVNQGDWSFDKHQTFEESPNKLMDGKIPLHMIKESMADNPELFEKALRQCKTKFNNNDYIPERNSNTDEGSLMSEESVEQLGQIQEQLAQLQNQQRAAKKISTLVLNLQPIGEEADSFSEYERSKSKLSRFHKSTPVQSTDKKDQKATHKNITIPSNFIIDDVDDSNLSKSIFVPDVLASSHEVSEVEMELNMVKLKQIKKSPGASTNKSKLSDPQQPKEENKRVVTPRLTSAEQRTAKFYEKSPAQEKPPSQLQVSSQIDMPFRESTEPRIKINASQSSQPNTQEIVEFMDHMQAEHCSDEENNFSHIHKDKSDSLSRDQSWESQQQKPYYQASILAETGRNSQAICPDIEVEGQLSGSRVRQVDDPERHEHETNSEVQEVHKPTDNSHNSSPQRPREPENLFMGIDSNNSTEKFQHERDPVMKMDNQMLAFFKNQQKNDQEEGPFTATRQKDPKSKKYTEPRGKGFVSAKTMSPNAGLTRNDDRQSTPQKYQFSNMLKNLTGGNSVEGSNTMDQNTGFATTRLPFQPAQEGISTGRNSQPDLQKKPVVRRQTTDVRAKKIHRNNSRKDVNKTSGSQGMKINELENQMKIVGADKLFSRQALNKNLGRLRTLTHTRNNNTNMRQGEKHYQHTNSNIIPSEISREELNELHLLRAIRNNKGGSVGTIGVESQDQQQFSQEEEKNANGSFVSLPNIIGSPIRDNQSPFSGDCRSGNNAPSYQVSDGQSLYTRNFTLPKFSINKNGIKNLQENHVFDMKPDSPRINPKKILSKPGSKFMSRVGSQENSIESNDYNASFLDKTNNKSYLNQPWNFGAKGARNALNKDGLRSKSLFQPVDQPQLSSAVLAMLGLNPSNYPQPDDNNFATDHSMIKGRNMVTDRSMTLVRKYKTPKRPVVQGLQYALQTSPEIQNHLKSAESLKHTAFRAQLSPSYPRINVHKRSPSNNGVRKDPLSRINPNRSTVYSVEDKTSFELGDKRKLVKVKQKMPKKTYELAHARTFYKLKPTAEITRVRDSHAQVHKQIAFGHVIDTSSMESPIRGEGLPALSMRNQQ